ncbi:MAG: uncharacterized protein KVP18_003664 [Porospora cf. gigantea A]|uniref:uncharacterized protein n=1 Tax=Porospora cf. gigantea A TaxID=2853593 RepID=UPI00355AA322|nr:MAG: hypothetical protein KVP18_003664 [Porospora cf. gigantea A]
MAFGDLGLAQQAEEAQRQAAAVQERAEDAQQQVETVQKRAEAAQEQITEGQQQVTAALTAAQDMASGQSFMSRMLICCMPSPAELIGDHAGDFIPDAARLSQTPVDGYF